MIAGDVIRVSINGQYFNEPCVQVWDFRLALPPFIGVGADPDDVTDEAAITGLVTKLVSDYYGALLSYSADNWTLNSWGAFKMFNPEEGFGGAVPGGAVSGALTTDATKPNDTLVMWSKGKVRGRGGGRKLLPGLPEVHQDGGFILAATQGDLAGDVLPYINNRLVYEQVGFFKFEFESVITHLVKVVNAANEVKGYRLPTTLVEWRGYVADNWAFKPRMSDTKTRKQLD